MYVPDTILAVFLSLTVTSLALNEAIKWVPTPTLNGDGAVVNAALEAREHIREIPNRLRDISNLIEILNDQLRNLSLNDAEETIFFKYFH